jgi:transposase
LPELHEPCWTEHIKAVLDAQEALQTEGQDPGVPPAWRDYQTDDFNDSYDGWTDSDSKSAPKEEGEEERIRKRRKRKRKRKRKRRRKSKRRRRMTPLKLQHLAVPVVHVEMLENMEEEHSGVTRPSSRSR